MIAGDRTIVTERLLEDSTSTPARSDLQIVPSAAQASPSKQDPSKAPTLPLTGDGSKDDSMDLDLGRAGSQMLQDISLNDIQAAPSPVWPEQPKALEVAAETLTQTITPSVFPGTSCLPGGSQHLLDSPLQLLEIL